RKRQIQDVHEAIRSSGVLNSNDHKDFVAPLTVPPGDIAEKIKSHQLAAH
ncbi:MAG: hypothetical protein HQL15_08525, partial [Candidatus Omnitrophica bacterium]|nr:hypothetical protein [Candidatus Omnitrophota bacterium]